MAINVADNFSYKGSKPLDARIKANTVSALVSTPAADLYDGCFAYVTETKKYYSYDSTNTSDPTLGKWREFQQGGGGGSTYTAGDGIDITNDVISTVKSEVGDMDEIIDELPSGGRVMVTGFTPIGTIISVFSETAPQHYLICDGSTYNKSDYPELAEHLLSLTTHSQYEVSGDDTKFKVPDLRGEFLRGTGTNSHTDQGDGTDVGVHQDATEHIIIGVNSGTALYTGPKSAANQPIQSNNRDNTIIRGSGASNLQPYVNTSKGTSGDEGYSHYTSRPTNTSVLYCIATKNIYTNPMNDYSIGEKVVGTWVDGKPIYQKTIDLGNLPNATTAHVNTEISNAKRLINYFATATDANGGQIAFPRLWIGGTGDMYIGFGANLSTINIATTSDRSGMTGYCTVQYTKTTD